MPSYHDVAASAASSPAPGIGHIIVICLRRNARRSNAHPEFDTRPPRASGRAARRMMMITFTAADFRRARRDIITSYFHIESASHMLVTTPAMSKYRAGRSWADYMRGDGR